MFRLLVATLFISTFILLLSRAAHAEPTLLRTPILPSIVAPLPRMMLGAAASTAAASSKATAMPATLQPVDSSFLGRVAQFIDGFRPPVSTHPRDAAGRNPTLRDPARERDATSFGIRTAPMSIGGAAFAGAGLGAGAAQLIDLAKVANKFPLKFAPTMCQGGGGLSLKADW